MRLAGLSRPRKSLLVLVCVIMILGVITVSALALNQRPAVVLTHVLPGFVPPWCDPNVAEACASLQGEAYDQCISLYCMTNP
jgi:hypothetical protein